MKATDRHREKGFVCAACGDAPTCPMLHDPLWATIAPGVGRTCMCGHAFSDHWGKQDYSTPCRSCPCSKPRQQQDVLCLECAERRLGRAIVVDDLCDSVVNYATRALVARALTVGRDAS